MSTKDGESVDHRFLGKHPEDKIHNLLIATWSYWLTSAASQMTAAKQLLFVAAHILNHNPNSYKVTRKEKELSLPQPPSRKNMEHTLRSGVKGIAMTALCYIAR